jgi:hypothetical protein
MVTLFRLRQGPVLPVNQFVVAVFEFERIRHREGESVLILAREPLQFGCRYKVR